MISYQKKKKERDQKRMYSLEKMEKTQDAVRAFHRKPYQMFVKNKEKISY